MMKSRVFQSIIISWLSMIATDFLLHAGVLADLYTRDSPFLLSADQAFARIPLGYLSFLLLTLMMFYFFKFRKPDSPETGLIEGLKIGGLVWLSLGIGIYSISTIDLSLTIGWIIGQTIEMGIGGYFLALGLNNQSIYVAWKRLGLFAIIVLSITIILQVSGIAPSMEIK